MVLRDDGAANGGGTYRHSKYDWRYFWRGGRAEHYAFDDGSATHYRYDGLLLMPGGGEHDVARGAPLGEDAHAYHRTTAEHVEWTAVQAGYAGAGTGSWWSKPSNVGHLALDLAGMIPVAGAVFDLANAGWYAYDGDYENAIWSGAAAIPGIGDAAMLARWGKRGVEAAGAGYKLARAATRGADIGVNFAQGGSAGYQGYQSGNYLQVGVGLLGIGMNTAAAGRALTGGRVAPMGGFAARMDSSEPALDFATRYEDALNAVVAKRMREVGVPEGMIGRVPNQPPGAFVVRQPAVAGSNTAPGLTPAAINVDQAVLDAGLARMSRVPSWGKARLRDRIDAIIAHEYAEVTTRLPAYVRGQSAERIIDFRHDKALIRGANSPLEISAGARQILREYRTAMRP